MRCILFLKKRIQNLHGSLLQITKTNHIHLYCQLYNADNALTALVCIHYQKWAQVFLIFWIASMINFSFESDLSFKPHKMSAKKIEPYFWKQSLVPLSNLYHACPLHGSHNKFLV